MIVGLSIEKSTAYRGGLQPFANTYYYEAPMPETDTVGWENLLDQLVTLEKGLHAASVSFVRGRVWRADGTKEQNTMIVDKPLSGVGALTDDTSLDRERACLIQIRAGVDTLGRPVYNRKWYHFMAGTLAGTALSNDARKQTGTLSAAQQTFLTNLGEDLKEIAVGVGGAVICTLTSKSGRNVTGAAKAHPYLEHHQLGDQWRQA